MYLARILYPVEVLGIGKRVGIWFDGCPHHCAGCSNPELWEQIPRYEIKPENALKLIDSITGKYPVDGFTITGGEPFYQPDALLTIISHIADISKDILVYTGYTLDGLHAIHSDIIEKILQKTAVLIDGKYIRERNTGYPLRGSDNQTVHILNASFRDAYKHYMQNENRIQNFMIGNSIVSVGIHQPDFQFMGGNNGISTEMA